MTVEYRVKPVTRYVVTRHEQTESGGGCEGKGQFDNYETAYAVAYALCKHEHDKSGLPPTEGFIYPGPTATY